MVDLTGQTIDDLHFGQRLGQGGMGMIYQATDLKLSRSVAVKVMHDHLANQRQFRERFLQEARSVANLKHDHIVPVQRFSPLDPPPQRLYLVMDLIAGGSLRDYLNHVKRAGKVIDLVEAVQLVEQIADALYYAHKQGMVHRDVKPENILLNPITTGGGRPLRAMLTDFGLAKLIEAIPFDVTRGPVGTYPYMSPEQCWDERTVDERTDIYALGIVLYELVVGALPFRPQTVQEAMRMHLYEPVPPPVARRPGLPSALLRVIDKCLAKNREDRYTTARELMHDLRAIEIALSNGEVTLPPDLPEKIDRPSVYVAKLLPTAPPRPQLQSQVQPQAQPQYDVTAPVPALPAPEGAAAPAAHSEPPAPRPDDRFESQADYRTIAEFTNGEAGQDVVVTLTPPTLLVTPGETGEMHVEISNLTVIEDVYRLEVRGLPGKWAKITGDTLTLRPGESGGATVTFSPPRESKSSAGRHYFTLHVHSLRQQLEVALLKERELNLTPFQAFTVDLHPKRLYNWTYLTLTIQNLSNTTERYLIRARDGENALTFTYDYGEYTVAPGQSRAIEIRVKPRPEALVHGAKPIPFSITVTGGGESQTVEGEMVAIADLMPEAAVKPARIAPQPVYRGATWGGERRLRPSRPARPQPAHEPSLPVNNVYVPSPSTYRQRGEWLTFWLILYTLAGFIPLLVMAWGLFGLVRQPDDRFLESAVYIMISGCAGTFVLVHWGLVTFAWGWHKWAVYALMFLSFFLFPVGPFLTLTWWLVMRGKWEMFG